MKKGTLMALLMFILCLTSSCGNRNNIDPVLLPYYNRFVYDGLSVGVEVPYDEGISMQFGYLGQQEKDGTVVGECSKVGYGGGNITIDKIFWLTEDYAHRVTLVYHELGHCVLSREHTTDKTSFMYPIIDPPAELYENVKNRQSMLNELFINMGK